MNATEEKTMKKTISLILCALLALSLCACGSAAKEAGNYYRTDSAYEASPAEAPMADEGYWADTESTGGLAMNGIEAKADAGEPETPALDPEKIIYSANVSVETTEFEQTLERLQAMVEQYGGFVESSSINGNNYYSQSRGYSSSRSANYTIRVPSTRFSELMGNLSSLGNVPYSNTYTENISARYYDVQARLNACRTQEQRLLEMMELAETVSDIIVIEDRLTELRYQIESLQSSLSNWDRQVSYSTVYLSVSEVTVYTPEATLTYGQQLGLALRNGLQTAGNFLKNALLVVLEALPMLLVLGVLSLVIFAIVMFIIRRSRRRKQLRREKKLSQRAAPAPEKTE